MTPEQRAALIAACDAGDEVRCTTIALQICATAAREGRTTAAMNIRTFIDGMHNREEAEQAYKRKRLEVAMHLFSYYPRTDIYEVVGIADALIRACMETPVP